MIQVKLKVEEAVGRTLDTYTATVYSTQLVNGTNYFVKVNAYSDSSIDPLQYDVTFF